MLFRQIVFYALLVGVLSGMLLTVVQFWQVIPIIQNAERHFESESVSAPVSPAEAAHDYAMHEHSDSAWAPEEGLERTGFTLLSNVLAAIGLALLVLVAIVVSLKRNVASVKINFANKLDWRHGLLWGAAGYAIFFLAPSLGVPPKIPGAFAAPLEARQVWWLLAVVFTATGLAGMAFGKSPWRWLAPALLVVPYLFGVPQPPAEVFSTMSPTQVIELEELARQFVSATAIANAAFWIALGITSVWAVRRIVSPLNSNESHT